MNRTRTLTAALAAAALLAGAGPAAAQTAARLSGSVSPASGATKRKPRSATVRASVRVPADRRATLAALTLRTPAHVRLSAKGFPTCGAGTVAVAGEGACPAGSRVGSLLASGALAGAATLPVTWTANVYAGSAASLVIAFKGLVPAVAEARLTGGGRRLTLELPPALRSPAGGLPLSSDALSISLGATRVTGSGSKRRTYRLAKLTGCPEDRLHRFAAQVTYDAGATPPSETLAATARCRR